MPYNAGDKVWVTGQEPGSPFPAGRHAGVVLGSHWESGWPYAVDVPGCPWPGDDEPPTRWVCREIDLRPRRDPDKQKREETGDWNLCPWQPKRATVSEDSANG